MSAGECWWPGLPGLIAELAGCAPARARELLAQGGISLESAHATGSSLNADGTPVEIAVIAAQEEARARVLMDPAHWETDPVRRARRARAACERLVNWLAAAPADRLLRGIEQAWPDDAAIAKWLPAGCLWLGAAPGQTSLAVYLSARWGPPSERWSRVFNWLETLGVNPGDPLVSAARWGEPASVSLAAGRELRVRVYYRLFGPLLLSDLALPALDERAMARFLTAVIGERPIRRAGLLLSVSGGLRAGAFTGCKVDICAHCASRGPAEWAVLSERLAAELDLPSPRISHVLLGGQAEMAFVGLGFPEPGARQLNFYLKAPAERRALPAAHA